MHDIFFDLENLRKTAEEDDDDNDLIYWFFGQTVPYTKPEPKEKSKGCICKECKEFSEYAEPNQEDGSFKCYSCKIYK